VSVLFKKNSFPIEVHQCLFGYQDGHRLLASSLRLPVEAASILLLLSDLAPGLSLPANGGYWTGIPLPSAKSYALMRTWLAPEMSRPGCVWTHALIISFLDLARLADLTVLVGLVTRPSATNSLEMYSEPILLSPSGNTQNQGWGGNAPDLVKAQRVIHAVYADRGIGKVVAPLGALDDAIFAVWSQQWPRLRRSFSFRTASSLNESISNTKSFNLAVTLGSDREQISSYNAAVDVIEPWEKACIDDLQLSQGTDFRRFIWRYGSDVRQGRKRFKFLANIFLSTRLAWLTGKKLHQVLESVTTVLSSPEDGQVLKEDLVGRNQYSLLPATDSVDLLSFYVNDPMAESLPALSVETLEAILHDSIDRLEEVFSIAEDAAVRNTNLGAKLLDCLAVIADASTFLSSTKDRPKLRDKLLTLNPSLLDCDELIRVPSVELLKLMQYVSGDPALTERILQRLLSVDDTDLAQEMVRRFPDSTTAKVFSAIELYLTDGGTTVPQSWVSAVGRHSSTVLDGAFIERARTTSSLSFFASMLGYAQPATLQVGPMPWANALKTARDDLSGSDRQKFLVFILELALHKPEPGCEPIFELAFESIHHDLQYSRLNWEQTSHLLQYLPNLSWLKNWDNCLRLKIAIVDAYVTCNLDPISFKRLTTNPDLYKDLIELADDSRDGHKFLIKLKRPKLKP
jgi:hypothetical protein